VVVTVELISNLFAWLNAAAMGLGVPSSFWSFGRWLAGEVVLPTFLDLRGTPLEVSNGHYLLRVQKVIGV
jgi:hypothetical protein